jgi:hypothetical protein
MRSLFLKEQYSAAVGTKETCRIDAQRSKLWSQECRRRRREARATLGFQLIEQRNQIFAQTKKQTKNKMSFHVFKIRLTIFPF